jgi:hypothetical protein
LFQDLDSHFCPYNYIRHHVLRSTSFFFFFEQKGLGLVACKGPDGVRYAASDRSLNLAAEVIGVEAHDSGTKSVNLVESYLVGLAGPGLLGDWLWLHGRS